MAVPNARKCSCASPVRRSQHHVATTIDMDPAAMSGARDDGNGDGDGPASAVRREAWSRYWAHGVPHSCVGSYGDCYGGEIAAFWRDVFGRLPAAARVLDIATGNGALPRLLLQHTELHDVHCDAVDIASIQPSWLAKASPADQARVSFHSGVDAAGLPFADQSFDLVVSQYGLEYTALQRSVPELLRVRALRGTIALVLHHSQGRPAALAAVELDHLGWLLDEGSLFDAGAALVEPMALAATVQGRAILQSQPQADAARERFNALLAELTNRTAASDGADVLFEAREALMAVLAGAGRNGAAQASALMSRLRDEYAGSATRLRDLQTHALGPDRAFALREQLAAALAAPVSLTALNENGHLMGWMIRAPAAPGD